MRKTYMSLAVSRAMATEYPVGDPFGGPAYDERRMPLVAIVGAAFGGAALMGTFGTLSVWGTIAAIGAVTAGIGVVTGNQDLVKIGGVMGLVGGVGSLATKAGFLSDVAQAGAGSGIDQAANAAAEGASSAPAAGAVAQGALAPITTGVQSTGGMLNQAAIDTADLQQFGVAQTAAGQAAQSAAQTPGLNTALSDNAARIPGQEVATAGGDGTGGLIDQARLDAAGGGQIKAPDGIMSLFKGKTDAMLGWAEKNQMFAYGMMQTGGKFLEGLFDSTAGQKKALLEAQTSYYAANAAQNAQQTANMSGPAPIGNTPGARAPLFGTPQPVLNAGILNSVTGRPA